MTYQPREIPEAVNVNVTKINPLVNLGHLLATVAVFGTAIYLGFGVVATQLTIRMSPEREQKMGQALVKGSVISAEDISPKQTQQLEHLQELLVELNGGQLESRAIPLQIHLRQDSQANAFAFPGGQIVVTTGLLDSVESENEIAFILAHELGHHASRDSLERLGRSLVLIFISTAIGIGSGNSDFLVNAASLGDLHYGRTQETEADSYALEKVVQYYGHGESSLDFFQRIHSENEDPRKKIDVYFSTHPLTEARINDLNKRAAEKDWTMRGEVTELPEDIF